LWRPRLAMTTVARPTTAISKKSPIITSA
jgi:hypothetical protein